MIAAVLLVHKEFVFLQGKTQELVDSDKTGMTILPQSDTEFFTEGCALRAA